MGRRQKGLRAAYGRRRLNPIGLEKWQVRKERTTCEACGDKHAWDKVHRCCEDQCTGILNALQAFPFAAWGDISAVPFDSLKVVAARRLEIEYAEKTGMEEDTEVETERTGVEGD